MSLKWYDELPNLTFNLWEEVVFKYDTTQPYKYFVCA